MQYKHRIIFKLSKSGLLLQLTALMFVVFPFPAGTETLTLTSYYPAPYGGYASLLATGQTLLARDGGNVGVGTMLPASRLDVNGGVLIGFDGDPCTAAKEGTLRRQGDFFEICTGNNWRGGPLQCTYPGATSDAAGNAYAACANGYFVTGGGCSSSSDGYTHLYVSAPLFNGWWCGEGAGSAWNAIQAYAVCCKISI